MWGNINALYSVLLILNGNICFNFFIIPIVLEHVFATFSMCVCKFLCMSNVTPKKLKCWTLSTFTASIFNVGTITLLFGI